MCTVRAVICVLAVLAAAAVFAPQAQAGSVTISPSKIEIELPKGVTGTFDVQMSSTATVPMSVEVRPWDFARDARGQITQVAPADADRFHGCSQWVETPSSKKTLPPGGTLTFPFKVNVPSKTADETRYCYLQFVSTPVLPEKTGDSGITVQAPIVYSMNALLLVRVGNATQTADTVLRTGVTVKSLSVKRFNFDPTVSLTTAIYNKGNIHANLAEGSGIQIWQGDTLKATIPFQQYTLLPENVLDVPATWKPNVVIGQFRARFIGDIGLDQPIMAERVFWVVKPWFLAALFAGVLLLAVLLFLFFKRFKIQLSPRSS